MSFLSANRLKSKIAPQLHRRVPFEAGIYANSPRWSNKDLDPVPVHMRTWAGLVSSCRLGQRRSADGVIGLLGILDV